MKYLTLIVHNEDYSDIHKYFYNESISDDDNIKSILNTCKKAITLDFKNMQISAKGYRAEIEYKTYKDLNKSGTLESYIFIQLRKDKEIMTPSKPKFNGWRAYL